MIHPTSVLSNAAVATGGRVIQAALGVVITAAVYRLLGAAGYGSYVVILSAGAILQMLADSGLYLTLTRLMAASPGEQLAHTSHIIWLRGALLSMIFGISFLAIWWVPSWQPWWAVFGLAALGLVWQSFSQLLMGVYQTYGVVWRATIGDLVGRGVQIGAIAFLATRSFTVASAVAAFTISSAVSLMIHRWLLPVRAVVARPGPGSWALWRTIVRESWPLGLMLVLNAIYFRIDTLLLSWLRSAVEVGAYGIAYNVMEKALFFPAMFGGLLLPRLAAALSRGQVAAAADWIEESLQLILLGVGAVVAIGIPLAPAGMMFITGQLSAAGLLLQILLVALAAMFVGNIFGFSLVAAGRQQFLFRLYACLVVFNIVGNLLLIPGWGAAAAAWTTVATELLSMGAAGWVVRRRLRWRLPADFVVRLGMAGGAAWLIVMVQPAGWHVGARAGIALAAYLSVAWAAGLLDRRRYPLLYAAL